MVAQQSPHPADSKPVTTSFRGLSSLSDLRQVYDRYPYPASSTGRRTFRWRLAPAEWLNALWRPATHRFAPQRVLVAGCGTGHEAFAISRRVPTAEIVAVDFSPRAIAIAQQSQRRIPGAQRIRFMVADLSDRRLAARAGRDFDFISCHGVLSYVPDAARVLVNLVQCLSSDGAVYLGVNGATHHSVRWRAALASWGIDPSIWHGSAEARRALRLFDALAKRTPAPKLASKSDAYLASDVFGPSFRNLPLDRWLRMARRAGLFFRGSHSCGDSLHGLCDEDLTSLLLPRSRAELHQLEELLIPSAFHRLLFTREPAAVPSWDNPRSLVDWRPVRLPLYRVRRPGTTRASTKVVRLASTALNLAVELRLERWAIDLLRRANGARRLGEFIDDSAKRVRLTSVRDTLYMLYLLGVADMLPPGPLRNRTGDT